MAEDDPDNPFKPSLAVLLNKLDPKDGAQIMDYLKTHFLMMREKALLQASVREEKKLLVENAKLKKDIEELKLQLLEKQKRKAAKALALALATSDTPSESPASSGLSVSSGPSPRVPATQSAAGPSLGQPVTQHDRQGRRRRGDRRARPVSDPCVPLGAGRGVDASRLDIRVGRVLSVRPHRAADALMVQEVDVAEATPRTVVTPLDVQLEVEKGVLVLLLCNIKPCQLKGVVSQARLLCCSAPDSDDMELLAPPPGAAPGDRVTFHNYPGDPDKVLLSKDRVWETVQSDLKTDGKGVANYKGVGFEVRGKGLCRAPTLTNAPIR